jgi:hypothetical protein
MAPLLALLLVLLVPLPAAAQDRGYVAATGGATFMAKTAATFGAESGIHLTPNLVVFGQAGRMQNVLPRSVQDDIDEATATLESFVGRPFAFDARIRALYAGGGVRYLFATRTAARPYVLGSVNVVSYEGSLHESELGDVLDLAISFGVVDRDDVKGSETAYEVGGGVTIPRGRVSFDAGYRLMNVKGVNISRVAAAVGARF